MRSTLLITAVVVVLASTVSLAAPATASAGIPSGACNVLGALSGAAGKACTALRHPGELLKIGKSLITGHIGTAIQDFLNGGGGVSASTAIGLAAVVAWVVGGAKAGLSFMVGAIESTAAPHLGTVWFSSTYWRVAGMAALLTLPFLFAAAVQALIRSDLAILSRAAFGYLPLAMLCVAIAAPITMLLLAATDELCSLVWTPSSSHALTTLFGGALGGSGLIGFLKSPFLTFLLALLTAGGAVVVWLELVMREAAVYVVVLLLPLAFAALVWPARRMWALRSVEMLVALILSKFAIVAVLGLGVAALSSAGSDGVSAVLAGMVLVILAAFAPWVLLRLLPMAEVASGAASALRPHTQTAVRTQYEHTKTATGYVAGATAALRDRIAAATDGAPLSSPDYKPEAQLDEDAQRDERELEVAAFPAANGNGALSGAPTATGKSAAAAGGTAGASATGGTVAEAPGERVPGAAPMWQAPDMSWNPMTLGMDDGWPPPAPWTPDDTPPPDPPDGQDGAPADDSDPLPPGQDSGSPL